MLMTDRTVGNFHRFTSNVAIYEGECIGVCRKGESLYRMYPAFSCAGMNKTIDVSQREDRYIMRTRDSRLMAVMGSRIYEQIKRPEWAA